jgi:hypothetical protein
MNERIQELSKQAGLKIEYQMINPPKPLQILGSTEQILKFAELIVRECAEVAQDFVTVENNKLVEHVHISPWQLQDKIKEHFGVEE